MNIELYNPRQADALHDVLLAAADARQDPDPTRRQRLVQMEMVQGDVIAKYAEQYLSDPDYLSRPTREEQAGFLEFSARAGSVGSTEAEKEQLDDALKLIRQNPHLSKTFGVISDIVYEYMHDLDAVASTLEGENAQELQAATKNMLGEAEIGFFSRELLPYMFYGMADDVRGAPSIEGVFEKALQNARGNGAFITKGTCPFGNKISSVMDLAPEKSEFGQVRVRTGEKDCALPTFIFNEILTDIRMSAAAKETPAHP